MVSGIQVVVMIFAIIMLFMSYNFYRRKSLQKKDIILWSAVWVLLFIAGLFPQSVSFLVQTLHIERGMDFFTIFGFIFLLIVVFSLYVSVFRMQDKIEKIVAFISQKEKYRKK